MEESKNSGETQIGPHYTLMIPFDPAMNNPKLLLNLLKSAGDKAEKEIILKYSKEKGAFLIQRLREVLKEIKRVPQEKTIAVFISHFAKNVYYFTPTTRLSMPSIRENS